MTNQFSSSRYPHADGGHAMNGVCFFSFIFLSVLFFVIMISVTFRVSYFFVSFCIKSRSKYVINLFLLILEMQLEQQNLYLYM